MIYNKRGLLKSASKINPNILKKYTKSLYNLLPQALNKSLRFQSSCISAILDIIERKISACISTFVKIFL